MSPILSLTDVRVQRQTTKHILCAQRFLSNKTKLN